MSRLRERRALIDVARRVREALVPRVVRRAPRTVVFSIVSLALFMSAVDGTIVATGLPTIGHALQARLNWTSWTMTAYALGLVVSMPVAGRVADAFGRTRVFVVSAVVFTAASLACGLVDDISLLIVFRVVQALGGGAFVPAATGLVSDVYGERRDEAVGLLSTVFPLGALVGPILGGVIVSQWSWRGVFLVNVPVGVLFTLLAVRYLPRHAPVGGRVDLMGTALLGTSVLAAMLAITHLGEPGTRLLSSDTLGPLALAAAAATVLFWHCARRPDPVIPIRFLTERGFAAMNGINFVWGACAIGFGSLVPLFAEDRFHMAPLAAGTLLTARALGEMSVAAVASLLIGRTGYRAPMIAGFLLIAGGMVMLALPPVGVSPAIWLGTASALTGVGTGASAPAANNATLQLSPGDVGAISGLRGASRQAGAIIGVALATSFMARSSAHALTLGHAFNVLALGLLLVTPFVFIVPERARRLVAS